MTFTHMVILKKSPWYVYSTDEEDAISIAEKFEGNVIGVVHAPKGLEFQHIKTTTVLERPDNVRMIDYIQKKEVEKLLDKELDE